MDKTHTWPHGFMYYHQLWLNYFWCSTEIKNLKEQQYVWSAVPREKKSLLNCWNWSAEILRDEVHSQWIPWSGDLRFIIIGMTTQILFFFSWWRRKKLNRKFPKLTNFEVCCHLHVYPAQTMCPGALKFHFESALKQIFFTNTILHFKSNHFKVNSSFPMPVVTAIASRKLRLFLKLHLFNSTLQTFLFILCICK